MHQSTPRRPASLAACSLYLKTGVVGLIVLLAACGSSGTGPNGGGGGGGGGNGPMNATIDGQAWTAAQNSMLVTSSQNTPGFLTITGLQFSGTD